MSETQRFIGLVIRAIDYREKDRVLNIFTLEEGMITATLRGAKNPNSKLKSFGMVFCFAEWEIIESKSSRTIVGATMIDDFIEITADLDKYYAGAVALSIAQKLSVFPEMVEFNKSLLTEIVKFLREVCYGADYPKVLLVKFMTSVLDMNGYGFSTAVCAKCGSVLGAGGMYSLDDGSMRCVTCATLHSINVSLGVIRLIDSLRRDDYDKLDDIDVSEPVVIEAIRLLALAMKERMDIDVNISLVIRAESQN